LFGRILRIAGREAILLRSDFARSDLMFPAFGPRIVAGGIADEVADGTNGTCASRNI
jgi:hypothetical protein